MRYGNKESEKGYQENCEKENCKEENYQKEVILRTP